MTPDFATVETNAARILERVPSGVARGETAAGLYGLGLVGRWAAPQLVQRGVRLGACYDANPALHGAVVENVPIRGAGELRSATPEFVFVGTRHAVQPVSAMLSGLNIRHVSCDAWHAASDLAAFRRVHDGLLQDARSREVLRAVLMAMLTGDTRFCAGVCEKDQYFCLPRFWGGTDETYVDAGAFVGDSVERFIWAQNGVFRKILAFEPGARQFAALKSRAGRLVAEWALAPDSLVLVNAGLGEAAGRATAASPSGQLTGLAVRQDAGGDTQILSLDRFIEGGPVTFLKADVEGMEMALLRGARETLARCKPKLAICAYHYPADIPDIANFLAELVPDYRFALRHHSPQLMETVLYAWTD